MLRLIVNGAAGRMGRRLVALAAEDPDIALAGAFERRDHPDLGKDAGLVAGVGEIGLAVATRSPLEADAAVDFSSRESSLEMLRWCPEQGIALVVGTTGLAGEGAVLLEAAAKRIPCLMAPNMSLGVNLLFSLVGQVAAALGDDYDVEIIEAHHRFKRDAPSGTALRLGERVAEALGRPLDQVATHGRRGLVGERPKTQIGFHAVRAGDIVGEHTVVFGGVGERVELHHVAGSRDTFARGALRAAKFLVGKPPGAYSMADVLGLKLQG